jgi:hypothetical protein
MIDHGGRPMTLAEVAAAEQPGGAGGWSPGEQLVRNAVRAMIIDGLTGPHVGQSMAHAVDGLRQLTAHLPLMLQDAAGRVVDRLDVMAADPENTAAVAEWAKSVVLPLLAPTEGSNSPGPVTGQ